MKDLGTSLTTDSVNIAKNIVDGLRTGISSNDKQFTSALSQMINSSTNNIKRILGIHSPSTVYAEIGTNLVLGLERGFSKQSASSFVTIKTLINNLTTTLTTNVEQSLVKLQSSFESHFSSVVATVRTSVSAMSSSISSLISEINNLNSMSINNSALLNNSSKSGDTAKTGNTDNSVTKNTYNFYSTSKLSEVECAREMKKAQRDLSEGFV